jgi:hypothetical protein
MMMLKSFVFHFLKTITPTRIEVPPYIFRFHGSVKIVVFWTVTMCSFDGGY